MNQFGEEFYTLYLQNQNHNFFVDYSIDLGEKKFAIVEFMPVNSILNNCYKIAVEKAKYTMDEGQDLQKRDKQKKVINQFKGIMAETAIQLYLLARCNFTIDSVKRWDLERESFADTKNEYDLKITQNGIDFFIESRSSSSYKTDLRSFMMNYDIIGKYVNQRKINERISDLYVRPVFQYVNYTLTQYKYEQEIFNTFSDISANKLKLYLVAAASKREMYGQHGYNKNMRQGQTIYQCIKIRDAQDIRAISAIYKAEMQERGRL